MPQIEIDQGLLAYVDLIQTQLDILDIDRSSIATNKDLSQIIQSHIDYFINQLAPQTQKAWSDTLASLPKITDGIFVQNELYRQTLRGFLTVTVRPLLILGKTTEVFTNTLDPLRRQELLDEYTKQRRLIESNESVVNTASRMRDLIAQANENVLHDLYRQPEFVALPETAKQILVTGVIEGSLDAAGGAQTFNETVFKENIVKRVDGQRLILMGLPKSTVANVINSLETMQLSPDTTGTLRSLAQAPRGPFIYQVAQMAQANVEFLFHKENWLNLISQANLGVSRDLDKTLSRQPDFLGLDPQTQQSVRKELISSITQEAHLAVKSSPEKKLGILTVQDKVNQRIQAEKLRALGFSGNASLVMQEALKTMQLSSNSVDAIQKLADVPRGPFINVVKQFAVDNINFLLHRDNLPPEMRVLDSFHLANFGVASAVALVDTQDIFGTALVQHAEAAQYLNRRIKEALWLSTTGTLTNNQIQRLLETWVYTEMPVGVYLLNCFGKNPAAFLTQGLRTEQAEIKRAVRQTPKDVSGYLTKGPLYNIQRFGSMSQNLMASLRNAGSFINPVNWLPGLYSGLGRASSIIPTIGNFRNASGQITNIVKKSIFFQWWFWVMVVILLFIFGPILDLPFFNDFVSDIANTFLYQGDENLEGYVNNESSLASGTCPIENPKIIRKIYDGAGGTGHGSDDYWNDVTGGIKFSYPIPDGGIFFGCNNPADCAGHPEYYGLAIDVADKKGGPANLLVPYVCARGEACTDDVITWTVDRTDDRKAGTAVYLTANANGHGWKILLLHVDWNGKSTYTTEEGQNVIGTLTPQSYSCSLGRCDNSHVHFEISMDTIPINPLPFCVGSSGVPIKPPPESGYCSTNFLTPYFGNDQQLAKAAACICHYESGGRNDILSHQRCTLWKTQPGRNTREFSWGLFQVNILAHDAEGTVCRDAFTFFDANGNEVVVNSAKDVTNKCDINNPAIAKEDGSGICDQYYIDPENNARKAYDLYQGRGNWDDWYYSAGLCGLRRSQQKPY